ncbi:MAG: rhodanese-like domain-containing protein, partial [Sphingobacterium sp.]
AAELITQWHATDLLLVDVRELDELPPLPVPHLSIPLETLPAQLEQINSARVIFICQSGKRSLTAAQYFHEQAGNSQQIFHVDGGMMALKNYLND